MKLKVVLNLPNENDRLTDYSYILPQHIENVENSTCLDIDLSNTLDYISNRLEFIKICTQKLRHNGTLSLSGTDIVELSKLIIIGEITIEEANEILFKNKQSIDNLYRLILLMENFNFQILDKRINGITYYIKAYKG